MRLAPRMKLVCLRYAGDRELAQDYMQEGFIRLFNKIGSYRGESSLETWSTRLFINHCITLLNKEKKSRNMWTELDENIDHADDEVSLDEVMRSEDEWLDLMIELPAGYRTVMNLYVFEEKSHKEISELLGISENTSKSQLFKARRMLKDILSRKRR